MADTRRYRGDMQQVVEMCGKDVADQLHEILSGLNLYIPKALRDDHPLDKLEPDAAEAIITAFGGSRIYVSSPQAEQVDLGEIEAMIEKGHSVQQIALKLGITERHVMRLRKNAGMTKVLSREDPRQLPLFD